MNDKSEFLSSVSHEVRTLLNTIVGLSEDISDYEDIPEEMIEDVEDLKNSSKTLFELIDNILDYITIKNGKMKIINGHYNPKELFENLAKKDEEYIGDKPIYLHTNIALDIPYELDGDRKNIKKIVNNLLTNAIKYTDGGDVWFDVKFNNQNNNLIVSVKDTGRGMKPEEMEKLFQRIESLNVERDNAGAAGLGLAITKQLIDMMNGKIDVESIYGEGSTFVVSIPQEVYRMEEDDLSRTQRLKLQAINYDEEGYGYKKVLVVDDNELNIKVVRRILEQYDLVLDECYNGQECIDMVSEDNDYDLIFMDIMMPGMNGEETLRKLNEIDGFETPVIALTAEAEPGAEEKYESEGFVDYLAKPFSKDQIKEKLDKVFKEEDIREEEQEW